MLSVSNITVEIKSFTILRGVSIEVADGEIVGLVGRNGAGKRIESVLLACWNIFLPGWASTTTRETSGRFLPGIRDTASIS